MHNGIFFGICYYILPFFAPFIIPAVILAIYHIGKIIKEYVNGKINA